VPHLRTRGRHRQNRDGDEDQDCLSAHVVPHTSTHPRRSNPSSWRDAIVVDKTTKTLSLKP
jgi:hypothetical protein